MNMQSDGGITVVMCAIVIGDNKCFKVLMAAGTDVTIPDDFGSTVLHLLFKKSLSSYTTNFAKPLLAAGAQVNKTDEEGNTAVKKCLLRCRNRKEKQLIKTLWILFAAGDGISDAKEEIQNMMKEESKLSLKRLCRDPIRSRLL